MMRLYAILISLIFVLDASAGYKRLDLLQFSSTELEQAQRSSDVISKTAAECLQQYFSSHVEFHRKHGFSKFYGNRRYSHSEVKRFLRSVGKLYLLDQMENISCVDLTRRCLERGFASAGMSQTWSKIDRFTIANGVGGTAMQLGLQKIGWRVLYWNPTENLETMKRWDKEDFRLNGESAAMTRVVTWASPWRNRQGQYIYNPVWGMHVERFQSSTRRGKYYLNPVDDVETLVGFDDKAPEFLRSVPFFVGIAHAGYHVFPGSFGVVTEAHSTRSIRSIDNLEQSPFNPLGRGGGPRWTSTERYRSGLIAVPPGY